MQRLFPLSRGTNISAWDHRATPNSSAGKMRWFPIWEEVFLMFILKGISRSDKPVAGAILETASSCPSSVKYERVQALGNI